MNDDGQVGVRLDKYNNDWYSPGAGWLKRVLWYISNVLFLRNPFCLSSAVKRGLLRMYGAKIGKKVVIKPSVNIKYPWFLSIGDHAWIGENAWIDNLAMVEIGGHVCISQGALLLTGNHDYSKPGFDLIVKEISIGEGAWIGAKSVVGPGVSVGKNAVLSAGSFASSDLESNKIYRGNPAVYIKDRNIKD